MQIECARCLLLNDVQAVLNESLHFDHFLVLFQNIVRVVDRLGKVGVGFAQQRRILNETAADSNLIVWFVEYIPLEVVEQQA